jgi:transketolase
MNNKKVEFISQKIRKYIITMAYKAHGSHIGSSLSVVDILSVLYFKILNVKPDKPNWSDRDFFILSKGHACSALYATLAEKGFFPLKLLDAYMKNGSMIPGHVTKDTLPGVEATTGSLGHGLSIGTGIALSLKNDKKKSRVYVLIGDGEAEEGSVWEAIMFIGHHKLNNIILIIDNNNLQIMGKSTDILNSQPFESKLKSFGLNVNNVDGHNIKDLTRALKINKQKKPLAIIAKTVKGKGVSFMENKVEWHGKTLSKEDFERAVKELS